MRVHALSLLAVALAASACGSGIQVTTDWDPEQDFSRIQTFAVLDAPEGSDLTSLTQGRIKSAIREAMTAKGLRETSDADIAVGFQAIVDQRSSYQTVSTGWGGYGWGGGWGGMGVTSSQTTQRNYEVGTLIVAIANADGQLIFQSSGSKTLSSGNVPPDEAQRRWNDAVARILRDFPPGS